MCILIIRRAGRLTHRSFSRNPFPVCPFLKSSLCNLIPVPFDGEIIVCLFSIRSFQGQNRFAGSSEIGVNHENLYAFDIAYFHAAIAVVGQRDRIGVVKCTFIPASHDFRAVNRRVQQTQDRDADDGDGAHRGSHPADLLVFKDRNRIEDHRADAEEGDQNMAGSGKQKIRKIGEIRISGQEDHRQEDQISPPLALLQIIAYEPHREAENGPDKPVFIITEQAPALPAEGDLKQIDKRLADEKENKAFQSRIKIGLAVHDYEDTKQDPYFKRDGDRVERSIVKRRNDRHRSGEDARDDSGQDQLRPG